MENSLTLKYKRQAEGIERLVTSISYERFTEADMVKLIMLTDYIRKIPSDEVKAFRIIKYSESWFIYNELKNAFATRTLEEAIKEQLLKREEYELLNLLKY